MEGRFVRTSRHRAGISLLKFWPKQGQFIKLTLSHTLYAIPSYSNVSHYSKTQVVKATEESHSHKMCLWPCSIKV